MAMRGAALVRLGPRTTVKREYLPYSERPSRETGPFHLCVVVNYEAWPDLSGVRKGPQFHVAVDVFVEQVAEFSGAARVAGLRAECT